MPGISRNNDLAKTGHLCTPIVGVKASQSSVKANGTPLLRRGDRCKPHTILKGILCVGHSAKVNRASRTVFAEGIPVARIGDSTDMGAMFKGSRDVVAGG